jgi:hypothetical protein
MRKRFDIVENYLTPVQRERERERERERAITEPNQQVLGNILRFLETFFFLS